MEERFITIRGVKYIVSSDGKVYSTNNCGRGKYHKEITQRKNRDGYMQITVGKNGFRAQYRVHRIVAEAFIPNPNNLPEVNHKDNNRENNCVDNLEWCDHAYNVHYAIMSGNHVCTSDLHGKNNPNYGNKTLSNKYKNDPLLAIRKQSRRGAVNGRALKTTIFDTVTQKERVFDYIRSASQYLVENNLTKSKDSNYVAVKLSFCAKHNILFNNRFHITIDKNRYANTVLN